MERIGTPFPVPIRTQWDQPTEGGQFGVSVFTPVAESFRSVRHHLLTISVVTVAVASLLLIQPLIGLLVMLVATPMIIDLTVGKKKTTKEAFKGSRRRILRYLLWRAAVTVVGFAVVGTSLALVLWVFWTRLQGYGGDYIAMAQDGDVTWALWSLLLTLLAGTVGFVVLIVGDMLAVAAAAGYESPWVAVGKVFSKSKRWTNIASTLVVYAMVFVTLTVNAVAFTLFALKTQGTDPVVELSPEVTTALANIAEGLPPVLLLWAVMVVMAIITSFISSVMRPVMLAQIVADSAGPPFPEVPDNTGEQPTRTPEPV